MPVPEESGRPQPASNLSSRRQSNALGTDARPPEEPCLAPHQMNLGTCVVGCLLRRDEAFMGRAGWCFFITECGIGT